MTEKKIQPVKVRHATQCEFIPMTPVPDEWRGMRVRFIVEPIPEDEKTDFDKQNHWPDTAGLFPETTK